jgi:hypothetical protein
MAAVRQLDHLGALEDLAPSFIPQIRSAGIRAIRPRRRQSPSYQALEPSTSRA